MTGITDKNGDLTTLATYVYAYDGVGNLTSETDNGRTTTYAYDATSQLTRMGGRRSATMPTATATCRLLDRGREPDDE